MTLDQPLGDADRDRQALLELLLAEEGLAPSASHAIPKRAPQTEPVLSYAQERLWFLQEFETDTTALSIRAALRLSGPLDVDALVHSLDDLVARHSILRTTIRSIEGRPEPHLVDVAPMPLVVDDLRGDDESEKQVAAILAEEARRTFDLAHDLPILVRLVRVADDDHVLSVVMHHVASDGWSFQVFFRDLDVLYAAHLEGREAVLPDLPVDYADYAAWQRAWVAGEKLDRQLGYWKEQLAGELPICEIPPDFVRPAKHTFEGGQLQLEVPAAPLRALRELASGSGVTLFMVMLAAFDVLLARHTDADDVIVGTPVAGRVRSELEGMIGMFLNTLVLRTDLSDDPTFVELIDRVRDVSLGAFDNQDVSFEQLLAELQPARDLSRTPLFQVFFNMMSFDAETQLLGLSGLEREVLSQPDLGSKFDITLYVTDHGGRLDLLLVYNRMLYEPDTMRQLLDQYVQLLEAVAGDPTQAISTYPLVTPEAQAILPDSSQPLDASWHGSVPSAVRRQAAKIPDKIAVTDGSSAWTYRAVSNQMDRVAAWLCAQGIGEGHIVAVYGHRSASLLCAVAGVLASGAAYLLLDPKYPPRRLGTYLRTARPDAWLAIAAAGTPDSEVNQQLDELGITVRRTIPSLAELEREGCLGEDRVSESRLRAITDAIGPDHLACLTFTSGSTGEPKAVMGRHGSLTHFLAWQSERFGVTADDRFSLLSGLAHDPIQRDMFWAVWNGSTLVVPDPDEIASPGWLAEWLRRERITVAHLTPAMGQLMAESASIIGAGVEPVTDLRLALFIGDVLTRTDVARFHALAPEVTIVNLYGTTETQRASGHHVVDPSIGDTDQLGRRPREVLPLGVGIPATQLLVRSARGTAAGFGEVGEIWFRSPHLARGYLGRPDDTAAKFVEPATPGAHERMYRTGDRGRYAANGEVEFLGRRDDQVQLRGFRIELGEIRAALVQLPSVNDAVVQIRTYEDVTRLVAYVVAAPSQTPAAEDLRRHLRRQLPGHMVPSDFVLIPRIPLTPNGKLDRAALPAPDTGGAVERGGEARDALEEQLVRWWEDVLGRANVGIYDNFFDLGGYSLLATRLFAMIEAGTGKSIPLSALFEAPTIAELAEVIRGDEVVTESPSLVPIQPLGTQRPFFYVAPYLISVLQFAHLGVELGNDQPLYGLQPQGLDGVLPIHTRIEDMAAAYIRQIRSVQPHGPYRVGGHCSGSWVAFEMARQLEAAGEQLEPVLIVDQGPPPASERPPIKMVSYLLGRARFYLSDRRLRHAVAWQAKITIGRLRLRRVWNPSSEYVEEVRSTHRAAYRTYQGGLIKSDIVLVRSDESIMLADKFWYLGWKDKTTGAFHHTRSTGTHANLLERPYVEEFADRLRWGFGLSRLGDGEPSSARS